MEQIDAFASLLNLPIGATLKLAKDISGNRELKSAYHLSDAEKLQLYLFLYEAAICEGKIRPRLRA